MSLCAAMFSLGFCVAFRLNNIAPFVFFTTLFVYSGQRYYKLNFINGLNNTPRIEWMKENKKGVVIILATSLIGVILYGLPLLLSTRFNLVLISFCAFISIFYVVKIGKNNLREVPGLKVFLVTIVYFIIVCILPFQTMSRVEHTLRPFWSYTLLFAFQYLYILGITILFDIPDEENDNIKLKTIAQLAGGRRTIFLSLVFILPLMALLTIDGYNEINFWLFCILHFLFYFFLLRRENKHFYLSLFGEGILGLLGLYYYLI